MEVVAAILGLVALILLFLLVTTRRNAAAAATAAASSRSALTDELHAAQREAARAADDLESARAAAAADTEKAANELSAALAGQAAAVDRAVAAEVAQAEQTEKLDSLERYGVELKSEIAAANEQAESAQASAAEARAAADEAAAELEVARAEADTLRAQAAAVTSSGTGGASRAAGIDPELLWALEMTRSERTWRHSVAVDPNGPSPFPDAPDPLKLAVEVEASALREEVGAFIHVKWDAETVADPIRRLLILRVANELLAAAAREPQPFELIASGADDIVLQVRATEEGDRQIELEPPAFGTDVIAYRSDDEGICITIK